MSFTYIMGLLGGLALFLYGMQMMSNGLEAAAGNKMKMILEKLTANRLVGVAVGALVTAIIQSSSATTVMVVGFVNAGMMSLQQAVWIIMGANIGTTITGQLIALDIGALAPLIAFLGVACVVFLKNEKLKHTGEILAGLGILFIGMDMMGTAMKPLADSKEFVGLLTKFENPVLGIMAGAIFTAIIQSSSASVGILQALAESGVIGLHSAAFVLFGQNIGTCITAFLAGIGTSKNAKRTTVIHVLFNVIGTFIFTVLCLTTPIISFFEGFTPNNAPAQIANLHTTFNIVTTCLLLPVGTLLTKFAVMLLKDDPSDKEEGIHVKYLLDIKQFGSEKIGNSIVCMESIRKELERMLQMTKENVQDAFGVFIKGKTDDFDKIVQREKYIDFLNKEISKYITQAVSHDTTKSGGQIFQSYFSITSNLERIGDHAINIAEYVLMMKEKDIQFSDVALEELAIMEKNCEDLFKLLQKVDADTLSWHEKVAAMEQKIDDLTEEYRGNMFQRMQDGECSDETNILFTEILTDFERIGDHALNIAKEMVLIRMNQN